MPNTSTTFPSPCLQYNMLMSDCFHHVVCSRRGFVGMPAAWRAATKFILQCLCFLPIVFGSFKFSIQNQPHVNLLWCAAGPSSIAFLSFHKPNTTFDSGQQIYISRCAPHAYLLLEGLGFRIIMLNLPFFFFSCCDAIDRSRNAKHPFFRFKSSKKVINKPSSACALVI